jgi:hypothetical protein
METAITLTRDEIKAIFQYWKNDVLKNPESFTNEATNAENQADYFIEVYQNLKLI